MTTATASSFLLKCPACKFTGRYTTEQRDAMRADWCHAKHGGAACPECDRSARFVPIKATTTETECGARCTSSLGPVCDCKCGGENHAADHRR